jgi:hypothetical protein
MPSHSGVRTPMIEEGDWGENDFEIVGSGPDEVMIDG